MSVFLDAVAGKQTPYTPIWLNRQAGRYMPEYHALKGATPSLDFFKDPDKAAQATLDAQRILEVDAAILFTDLLPILEALGFNLDYPKGIGPTIANCIDGVDQIHRLPEPDMDSLRYIQQTVRNIRSDLSGDIGLIGFVGAPFTLASYAIEGGTSKSFEKTKTLMYSQLKAWDQLLQKLTELIIDYANLQIEAGVDVIQVFDSWVGCLSQEDYRNHVFKPTKRVMSALTTSVPVIYFGTGNAHLIKQMYTTGATLMALDWRSPLTSTWDDLGCAAIQGNLDPVVLCADKPMIQKSASRLLDEVERRPGHIFNLGHGISPTTPVDHVKYLVDFVHEYSSR